MFMHIHIYTGVYMCKYMHIHVIIKNEEEIIEWSREAIEEKER